MLKNPDLPLDEEQTSQMKQQGCDLPQLLKDEEGELGEGWHL